MCHINNTQEGVFFMFVEYLYSPNNIYLYLFNYNFATLNRKKANFSKD